MPVRTDASIALEKNSNETERKRMMMKRVGDENGGYKIDKQAQLNEMLMVVVEGPADADFDAIVGIDQTE